MSEESSERSQFLSQAAAVAAMAGQTAPPPGVSAEEWAQARKGIIPGRGQGRPTTTGWEKRADGSWGFVGRILPSGEISYELTEPPPEARAEQAKLSYEAGYYPQPTVSREKDLREKYESGTLSKLETQEWNLNYSLKYVPQVGRFLKSFESRPYEELPIPIGVAPRAKEAQQIIAVRGELPLYETPLPSPSEVRLMSEPYYATLQKYRTPENTYNITKLIQEQALPEAQIVTLFGEESVKQAKEGIAKQQVAPASPIYATDITGRVFDVTRPLSAQPVQYAQYESGKTYDLVSELEKGVDPSLLLNAGFKQTDIDSAQSHLASTIKLDSGERMLLSDYNSDTLTDDDRALIKLKGIEQFNEIKDTEYQAALQEAETAQARFETDNILLADGQYISRTDYNTLISSPSVSDDAIDVLNTQGLDAFNTFIQGIQDSAERERLKFLSEHIQIGDKWVSRKDIEKATPQQLATIMGAQYESPETTGLKQIPEISRDSIFEKLYPNQPHLRGTESEIALTRPYGINTLFIKDKITLEERDYLLSQVPGKLGFRDAGKIAKTLGIAALGAAPVTGTIARKVTSLAGWGETALSAAGDVLLFAPWGLVGKAGKVTNPIKYSVNQVKMARELSPEMAILKNAGVDKKALQAVVVAENKYLKALADKDNLLTAIEKKQGVGAYGGEADVGKVRNLQAKIKEVGSTRLETLRLESLRNELKAELAKGYSPAWAKTLEKALDNLDEGVKRAKLALFKKLQNVQPELNNKSFDIQLSLKRMPESQVQAGPGVRRLQINKQTTSGDIIDNFKPERFIRDSENLYNEIKANAPKLDDMFNKSIKLQKERVPLEQKLTEKETLRMKALTGETEIKYIPGGMQGLNEEISSLKNSVMALKQRQLALDTKILNKLDEWGALPRKPVGGGSGGGLSLKPTAPTTTRFIDIKTGKPILIPSIIPTLTGGGSRAGMPYKPISGTKAVEEQEKLIEAIGKPVPGVVPSIMPAIQPAISPVSVPSVSPAVSPAIETSPLVETSPATITATEITTGIKTQAMPVGTPGIVPIVTPFSETAPSPTPSPVITPEPIISPAPALSPMPQPEPAPMPRPTPVKTPVKTTIIPKTKTVTGIIPPRGKVKGKEELEGQDLAGAVTFRMGLQWVTVLPPYRTEDVYRTDPPVIRVPDAGKPRQTIQPIGRVAQKTIVVPVGNRNAVIDDYGKSIRFSRSVKRGKRLSIIKPSVGVFK